VPPPTPADFGDGIRVRTGNPNPRKPGDVGTPEEALANAVSYAAEFALVRELTKAGAVTNVGVTIPGWPADFVRIEVGLKPISVTPLTARPSINIRGNMIFE
jgi:hypothetical protein